MVVIHEDLHDIDPAHEHHVLTDLETNLTAQHREHDKGRDAQGNGQNDTKTTLSDHLTCADANEIRKGYHQKFSVDTQPKALGGNAASISSRLCMPVSWVELSRRCQRSSFCTSLASQRQKKFGFQKARPKGVRAYRESCG